MEFETGRKIPNEYVFDVFTDMMADPRAETDQNHEKALAHANTMVQLSSESAIAAGRYSAEGVKFSTGVELLLMTLSRMSSG